MSRGVLQVTAQGRRYRDPLRAIIERVEEGAGSDVLLLDCGHKVSKDHRREWTVKRTSCSRCRVWEDER